MDKSTFGMNLRTRAYKDLKSLLIPVSKIKCVTRCVFELVLYANWKKFSYELIKQLEKIAEGISDFGDFEAILFKTSDGRHFVRFSPFKTSEKPYIQWLPGNDYLEWLRCWGKCSAT